MKFRELFFRQEKKPARGTPQGVPRKGCSARGAQKSNFLGTPIGVPFFVGTPKKTQEVICNERVKNGKKGKRIKTV